MSDDDRASRVGRNEAAFREVNEQIKGLNQTLAPSNRRLGVVCECGESGCAQPLQVESSAYERVRSDPALFIVAAGHEKPDVEEVVDGGAGYIVVRKLPGKPEQIAEKTDPRG